MVYKWKRGSCYKANADKCKAEIDTLADKTAKGIVKYASNKKTELYKCFEWDDAKAAEKYRLYQAQNILCSFVRVNVDSEGNEYETRVYEKDSNKKGAPYRDVMEAFDDVAFKQIIINRVKRDIESMERVAISYQSFFCKPKKLISAMRTAKGAV